MTVPDHTAVDVGPDAQYRSFLRAGKFMLQRCCRSGRFFFYPRVAEPHTGRERWEWVEASGFGIVYSITVVHARPPSSRYTVALIDLDEGVRLMSTVDGPSPEAIGIGMRVKASIKKIDGENAIAFDVVDQTASLDSADHRTS